MKERVVLFGSDRSLVGITTEPQLPAQSTAARDAADRQLPAVLILNAGLIHRVGPNRLHVKLGRRFSELGFHVLRFDFSGLGDSPASRTAIPFDQRAPNEAGEAMDFLMRTCGVQSFLPVGICSGADVAFSLAQRDDRVVGAVLINGGIVGPRISKELLREAQARIEARYHRRRLADIESWARLLRGKSNMKAIGRTIARFFLKRSITPDVAGSSDPDSSVLHRLEDRGVQVLAVYSEGSISWDLLDLSLGIERITELENVRLKYIENSDHVFTPLWAQTRLADIVVGWATEVFQIQTPDSGAVLRAHDCGPGTDPRSTSPANICSAINRWPFSL